MLSENRHTWFHIYEHDSPSRASYLVEGDREGQSPGERRVGRNICLKQRILYVHTFLLSEIGHTAQIFPTLKEHKRQLLTAISWYMAWCDIQGVSINLTTRDGGRRLGPD